MTTATQSAAEPVEVRPRRVTVRKRTLRQLGIRVANLSPVGRQRLDAYVDLKARLALLDAHLAAVDLDQHASSAPSPLLSEYAALAEATGRALSELERHLDGAGTGVV